VLQFIVEKACESGARAGRMVLGGKTVSTPVFVPVATQAAVKGITQGELADLGAQMVLGNAYHLYLRPGVDLIRRAGGLASFMNWSGATLTDSGGYQVFSLAPLIEVTETGVSFRSHIDGSEHLLTPESAVEIQHALGADVIMAFDQPVGYPAQPAEAREATERSDRWAERCLEAHQAGQSERALFGIAQGGFDRDLREQSAGRLTALPFDGYAIGGLSVGEPKELTFELLAHTAPLLPAERPRYLMGVGTPSDIVRAVGFGVDMFDCVLPTRLGRNGTAFTRYGAACADALAVAGKVNLKNAQYQDDLRPLDPQCQCEVCAKHSRAYLRHLYKAGEILAARSLTYHNLYLYLRLMEEIREAILAGRYRDFAEEFLARSQGTP
jgi:queuine tRNA-ribosyltransferase